MFKLGADGGATQGGYADAAIQKALEVVADGRAGGFHVDGRFKYSQEHKMDFIGKRRHMLITGDGAASQLVPEFASDNSRGLWLSNLEQLIVSKINFVGQPVEVLSAMNRQYDCGNAFMATSTPEVYFDHVNVYGLTTTKWNPFGLFFFDQSGFTQFGGQIRGNAAPGQGMFNFKRAHTIHVSNVNVIDWGEFDDWHASKTTWAGIISGTPFTYAWYNFTEPLQYSESAYLGVPKFEHVKFDEAASYGVACDGGGDIGTKWMRGLKLEDARFNVRQAGIRAKRLDYLVVEDCFFTYRDEQYVFTVDCTNVKSTRLTRCVANKKAVDLRITGTQSYQLATDECKGLRTVLVPVGLKWTKDGVLVDLSKATPLKSFKSLVKVPFDN